MEMKSIFWRRFEYLVDRDLRPRHVSIELPQKEWGVEVIPACRDATGDILFREDGERGSASTWRSMYTWWGTP